MGKEIIVKLLAGVFLLSPVVSNAWEKVTALSEDKASYIEVKSEDQGSLMTADGREIRETERRYPAVHIGTDFARINFLVPFVDAKGKQGWPSLLDGKQALVSNVPQFFVSKKR